MKGAGGGDVYFSFTSPYAWRAAAALGTRPDLRWHPFWAPRDASLRREIEARAASVVFTPMPFPKVLYGLHEMRRRAARGHHGLALPRDRNACWDLPHLAFLEARRRGVGDRFLRRAYDARWEEGRDITRVEELSPLFDTLGLDPLILTTLAGSRAVRHDAADALCRAHRLGIFGVPFFVHAERCYWGIDRMEDFLSDLDDQWEATTVAGSPAGGLAGAAEPIPDPPPEVVETIGMYDHDHPGGCG